MQIVELPSFKEDSQVVQPILRNGIESAKISGVELANGTIFASSLVVGSQTWIHNVAWTATDFETITWGSGTIKLSSGLTYSIDAGNAVIAAKTYIYFDQTTTLKTSTTYSDAIGDTRILLAIVLPSVDYDNENGKVIIISMNADGTTIDGNKITTGKIQSTDQNTYFDLDNDRIIVSDDSGTPRVLVGYLENGF